MVNTKAQEIIALGGYGYSQADSLNKGDFYFAEARLMFPLSEAFRVGLYGGYVGYGNKITGTSVLLGREFKYGLALDSYGPLSYSYSYYTWLNGGMKNTTDTYEEGFYKSKTLTNEIFFSGGFSVTDEWMSWFGHNQIMFDYQRPISLPKISATWKGNSVASSNPYNKESFRITLESGIKRFGTVLNFEPLIKLGYGQDFGRNKSYYEFGGGIGLGVYKDWYREIFKVSVFQRNDFNGSYNVINSQTPSGRLNVELTFNATSALALILHK